MISEFDKQRIKAEIDQAEAKLRAASGAIENFGRSIAAVFKKHKTEMLVAVAVGVVLGGIFIQ